MAQLNHVGSRTDYQTAYRGDGNGWTVANTAFATAAGWRGDGINDDADSRGWHVSFRIPVNSRAVAAAYANE